MWSDIKTFWRYIWNILSLGSKINQIIKNQETIMRHLEEIKSPREKLDELIKKAEFMEKFNKLKIEDIERKGVEKSAKDEQLIKQIKKENEDLLELKETAINMIADTRIENKKLRNRIIELENKLEPIDWGHLLATGRTLFPGSTYEALKKNLRKEPLPTNATPPKIDKDK